MSMSPVVNHTGTDAQALCNLGDAHQIVRCVPSSHSPSVGNGCTKMGLRWILRTCKVSA